MSAPSTGATPADSELQAPDLQAPDLQTPDLQTPDLPAPGPHEHDAPAPTPETPGPEALAAAGDLLRALAAPVRIAIVLQLRSSPRCVHELVDALAVTQPLISQHLRVLKAAGVVRGDRRGREVVYRLVDDHLAHIVVDAVTHVEEES
ncbi:MAG TPA: metalloregulator ArsR/SmtB family transcription factor, partial [Actinomycetospora sp.]|nr:metalloregulator ArsR/SmtB family transcription factor [Actinomycetospora sp.]